MKKQSLSISVPEPCHEKWSEMTPVEKGRHCQSCQKTVVDFTQMPKIKIAEFLAENQGKMCGRFTSDQLNVALIPPKPNKIWLKYAAIFLGLVPAIGYSQQTTENNNTEKTHLPNDFQIGSEMQTEVSVEIAEEDMPVRGKIKLNKHSKINKNDELKGRVVDEESGEPILFGSVIVYNKEGKIISGAETDLDGYFHLTDISGAVEIEASYIGYQSTRIKIKNLKSRNKILLKLELETLMGDVITGIMFRAEKESWLIRQWKKMKSLFVTSFERSLENNKEDAFNNEEQIQLSHNLTQNDEGKSHSEDVQIKSETSTKNEQKNIVVNIFPNPTMNYVNVNLNRTLLGMKIQVTNIRGSILHEEEINELSHQLNVSSYQAGTYIISIIRDNKLIKSETLIKM